METAELKNNNAAPSELSAALHAKCVRCRKGNMFNNSMYGFKLQKMNDHCPYCNLKFEREPGYFYVSMFISYALNVAEMITLAVATYVITGKIDNPWIYLAVIFPGIFILSPFNYRYSRVILMYWLTPGLKYSPEISENHHHEISDHH